MFVALILPKKQRAHSQSFPRALESIRKEENKMMKNLKQLLFAVALVAGISISASAQKEDDKKPPPKEGKPPVIIVQPDKKPKDDKPKDDRKKPQAFMFSFKEE